MCSKSKLRKHNTPGAQHDAVRTTIVNTHTALDELLSTETETYAAQMQLSTVVGSAGHSMLLKYEHTPQHEKHTWSTLTAKYDTTAADALPP